MQNISSFFEKFQKILSSETNLKESIVLSIQNAIKVKIEPTNIVYKNNNIYLKENHFIKNEIFFKKQDILLEIYKLTGKRINDIY